MSHAVKGNEERTKRLILHEWWDKVAYGLIIFFAFMIWQSTERTEQDIQQIKIELSSFRSEVKVTLQNHSERISKVENRIEDLSRDLDEQNK